MKKLIAVVLLLSSGCAHVRHEGDVECRGSAHTWGSSGTTTGKSVCHTVTAEEAQASRE